MNYNFSKLDKIDISLYLIYESIERIMYEIEKDYKDIFQSITIDEFRRYIIDAKSIMGIFSFDLTKPLNIRIHSQNIETINRFNEEMSDFKYEH